MTNTDNSFDKYIYIIIVSLIGGQIGGAITATRLFALLFFLPLFKAYRFGVDKSLKQLFCLGILLEMYSIITLFWTPDFVNGLKELVYFPVHMLLFIEVVVFLRLSNNRTKTLINGWAIAFSLTALVALWEIITDNHLSQSIMQSGTKINYGNGIVLNAQFASVTFGNPNTFVTFIVLLFPFLLMFTTKWNKGMKMILSYVPAAIAGLILIINGSRGGILTALICVLVFIFFRLTTGKAKVSFLSISVLIVFAFSRYWNSIAFYLTHRLKRGISLSNSGRDALWHTAWEILKKYYFFGTGIGGMNVAYQNANSKLQAAHSMLVEFGMQFGLLAVTILCIIIFSVLIKGIRNADKNLKFLLYSVLLSFPFSTIIDSGYFNNPVVWVAAGSYYYIATKSTYEHKYIKEEGTPQGL